MSISRRFGGNLPVEEHGAIIREAFFAEIHSAKNSIFGVLGRGILSQEGDKEM
jgi:hypothetical protein